jgi:hypothetical protein
LALPGLDSRTEYQKWTDLALLALYSREGYKKRTDLVLPGLDSRKEYQKGTYSALLAAPNQSSVYTSPWTPVTQPVIIGHESHDFFQT